MPDLSTCGDLAEGTSYHWVIAIQWEALTGYTTASVEGVVTVIPGQKRHEVFERVLDFAKVRVGLPPTSTVTVLFFSLEPDELPDVAERVIVLGPVN